MLRHTYNRLLVSDFPATFRFYRDILGFKPLFGEEHDVYVEFETGGATLALFRRELMSAVVGTDHKPLAADIQDKAAYIFEVEKIDTAYEELVRRGVEFITVPTDRTEWGIRTAHFRDPEGNLLEIYSRLP